MAIEESDGAPEHHLERLFKGDLFFMPVVRHLLGKAAGDSIAERRRAAHRAEGFMIEDGNYGKSVTGQPTEWPTQNADPQCRGSS